ncbi:hypothetical protein K0817_008775 [Microbacterium sp. HD4P20]|uniref:hypothetical protein n=1 Tax=Microbacterium sp. HD4P20 TaxID=2864874 RepID=UPI001C642DE9|nr:hypothetical protein [Microbacterium sp. HD4P20]MCP2636656.1 hypothetical protein [Microbacterium sp. HD4P20]
MIGAGGITSLRGFEMIKSDTRFASMVVGAVVAAAALSGCASTTPSGDETSAGVSTPEPDQSVAEPTPTDDDAVVVAANVPTDCLALGTAQTRDETVGDMTLQSDGEGFVRPAPEGATLALGCDWIVGDATGVLLLISTASPDAVAQALTTLPEDGYTCQPAEDFGVEFCDLPGEGTDTEELIAARDDVWIYMSTANRNGRAFFSDIVQGIFG